MNLRGAVRQAAIDALMLGIGGPPRGIFAAPARG